MGSPDFVFPQGVGLHLKAGQRLLLNLHLYNASDETLTGRSGTLVQEAMPDEIQHEAEIVLAGPTLGLQVPTGVSTQSGSCDLTQNSVSFLVLDDVGGQVVVAEGRHTGVRSGRVLTTHA